jgi:hypothetical protein
MKRTARALLLLVTGVASIACIEDPDPEPEPDPYEAPVVEPGDPCNWIWASCVDEATMLWCTAWTSARKRPRLKPRTCAVFANWLPGPVDRQGGQSITRPEARASSNDRATRRASEFAAQTARQ